MAAGKRRKSNAAESGDAEDSDHIDEEVVFSIEKLQEIQDELDKVNEEASDEVLKVELKYNKICRPIYSRRNEIIHSIPDFWLTAFLSHPALGALINDEDQKILKHLISIDVKDFNDVQSGYSITLNFSPNPYFEEKKLTKTYTFFDEVTVSITATEIKWKNGMVTSNGSAHKKKCSKRPFEVVSFFSWFSTTQQNFFPEGIVDEIAEIIREDLWPNPLKYFNNLVQESDEEDFDVDNDDDDEDEGKNDGEGDGEDDD